MLGGWKSREDENRKLNRMLGGRKSLEDENRKLKKLLAESMLDVATLREALARNF
jgi:hypothetical protein